jgi:hypothetical protein
MFAFPQFRWNSIAKREKKSYLKIINVIKKHTVLTMKCKVTSEDADLRKILQSAPVNRNQSQSHEKDKLCWFIWKRGKLILSALWN